MSRLSRIVMLLSLGVNIGVGAAWADRWITDGATAPALVDLPAESETVAPVDGFPTAPIHVIPGDADDGPFPAMTLIAHCLRTTPGTARHPLSFAPPPRVAP